MEYIYLFILDLYNILYTYLILNVNILNSI